MDNERQYAWWIRAVSGADAVEARGFGAVIALKVGRGGISRVLEKSGVCTCM